MRSTALTRRCTSARRLRTRLPASAPRDAIARRLRASQQRAQLPGPKRRRARSGRRRRLRSGDRIHLALRARSVRELRPTSGLLVHPGGVPNPGRPGPVRDGDTHVRARDPDGDPDSSASASSPARRLARLRSEPEAVGPQPGERRLHEARLAELPDGAFVLHDEVPRLVLGPSLLTWSAGGYLERRRRPANGWSTVITPSSLVALLQGGWTPLVPLLHPTARGTRARSRR
jgi:hypothetical protein